MPVFDKNDSGGGIGADPPFSRLRKRMIHARQRVGFTRSMRMVPQRNGGDVRAKTLTKKNVVESKYSNWTFRIAFFAVIILFLANNSKPCCDIDSVDEYYSLQARLKGSSLRLDWTNLPPMSPLGKIIERSQSRCLNSSAVREYGPQDLVHFDLWWAGMGSSLHTWMTPLCHAASHDMVLVTGSFWAWNNEAICTDEIKAKSASRADPSRSEDRSSSLWCYFGHHESGLRCPPGSLNWEKEPANLGTWKQHNCKYLKQYTRKEVTSAVSEWLFQNVSQIVIKESERQIREAFPFKQSEEVGSDDSFQQWPGLPPSESLITVHIRWGDKAREMNLCTMEEIMNATRQLLTEDELSGKRDVHIYVVTEDPRALNAFELSAPLNWIVHSSGPKINPSVEHMLEVKLDKKMRRHEAMAVNMDMIDAATNSGGRAGLESLAGLLVSLEANRFVLMTGSNWSRLIDELRRNVLDLRCNNCTQMIDLRPQPVEEWW